MDKSLALVVPDRPGVLREVIRIFDEHEVFVQRISYNRVVDIHALFVDVWGTSDALAAAEEELRAWRFMPGQRNVGDVRLIELGLGDDLSLMDRILAFVNRLDLNITYIDIITNSAKSNKAQLGVYVTKQERLEQLLRDLRTVCDVRLVSKSNQPDMLDNNHFNLSFADGLTKRLGLTEEDQEEILINSNRLMQNLMHEGSDPYKPFEYINHLADAFAFYRGPAYGVATRVCRFKTSRGVDCVSIEPPVGSTTWILECDDRLLCIDGGYCCFEDELKKILIDLYPDWDQRRKELVITHGDEDHVGATDLFDRVYASGRVIDNFLFEKYGVVNWREQNPKSFPFVRIGNVLSNHRTPEFESMQCLGPESPMGEQEELLKRIDALEISPFFFEVWEGKGGHVRGETILIDREQRVCVSGDVFVNVHGETKPQAQFGALAPYLMTSVDSDPELARREREALFELLGNGTWQILGGHGGLYEWRG